MRVDELDEKSGLQCLMSPTKYLGGPGLDNLRLMSWVCSVNRILNQSLEGWGRVLTLAIRDSRNRPEGLGHKFYSS